MLLRTLVVCVRVRVPERDGVRASHGSVVRVVIRAADEDDRARRDVAPLFFLRGVENGRAQLLPLFAGVGDKNDGHEHEPMWDDDRAPKACAERARFFVFVGSMLCFSCSRVRY